MALQRNSTRDFGALEQRVYNVEQGLQGISQQIGALSAKIDERGKTPWATLVAGGGLMLGIMTTIGVLAYRPIEAAQLRIEQDGREYRLSMAGELRRLDGQIVPRGEHIEKWRANDQALLALDHRIDEMRKDYGSTYSLRDAFSDLQRKVNDLEKDRRKAGVIP